MPATLTNLLQSTQAPTHAAPPPHPEIISPQTERRLLALYAQPDLNFDDLLANFPELSIDDVLAWSRRPDIAARLADITAFNEARAEFVAKAEQNRAIAVLTTTIRAHLYNQEHRPVGPTLADRALRMREQAVALRAATTLLRLTGALPAPRPPRHTRADDRPEPPDSGPPHPARPPLPAAPLQTDAPRNGFAAEPRQRPRLLQSTDRAAAILDQVRIALPQLEPSRSAPQPAPCTACPGAGRALPPSTDSPDPSQSTDPLPSAPPGGAKPAPDHTPDDAAPEAGPRQTPTTLRPP